VKRLDLAGLLAEGSGGKRYDRFRDRVMFPIRDGRGRVIGFGGRVLGDAKPKYLNSPETPVFHKGRELYGLYEAKRVPRDDRAPDRRRGLYGRDRPRPARHPQRRCDPWNATTSEHLDRLFKTRPGGRVLLRRRRRAGREAAWKGAKTPPCRSFGRARGPVPVPAGGRGPGHPRPQGGCGGVSRRRVRQGAAPVGVPVRPPGRRAGRHHLDGRARLASKASRCSPSCRQGPSAS